MKILYTDSYSHSINPTHALMPALVASAASDARFYGPGFSSERELADGILRFAERTGPYDAVILGPAVPLFGWSPERRVAMAKYWRRYAALSSTVPPKY